MCCCGLSGLYSSMQGDLACKIAGRLYGNLLEEIVGYIRERRHDNLFLHENGLLYTNGTEKAVTWMNSTANGRPVIPRTGYIVEVNALVVQYPAFCSRYGSGGRQ